MLSVNNKTQFYGKNMEKFGIFILMFVMCIGLVSVFVGFGSFAVVDCKDLTERKWTYNVIKTSLELL